MCSFRLRAAAASVGLVGLVGCGDGSTPGTTAPEASATVPTVVREGNEEAKVIVPGVDPIFEDPATLDELANRFPASQKLAFFQQEAAVGVLNAVPAPCDACPEESLGRCAIDAPTTCPNLPGLVARVLLVLGSGGSPLKARDSVLYSDAWFPVPADHTPLAEFSGSVALQVFIDPAGSFFDQAVASLSAVQRSDAAVILRYLPSPDQPGAELLSHGAMAAERQGLGLAFLQATVAWRAENRAAERRGKAALSEGASVGIATGLTDAGLDLDRWMSDRNDPDFQERLADDRVLAEQIGVRATPTWFVNGYRLRGAQSPRAVNRLVELEKDVQGWDVAQP